MQCGDSPASLGTVSRSSRRVPISTRRDPVLFLPPPLPFRPLPLPATGGSSLFLERAGLAVP